MLSCHCMQVTMSFHVGVFRREERALVHVRVFTTVITLPSSELLPVLYVKVTVM
jgi:hypothetical protein